MKKPKKPKTYGTSRGIVLTDELLDRLADEAEAGYDPSRLTPRRGRPALGTAPASVFQVRLEPELRASLEQRAADEQITPSELARRILRAKLL